jgi:4-hydroxy-tetrahydrodipicolinate reductase
VTLRIALLGAAGRMGTTIAAALAATDDLELVAAIDPANAGGEATGGLVVSADREVLRELAIDVAIEFTGPASVGDNLCWLLDNGIDTVVGATGIDAASLERAGAIAATGRARALIVPNFSIGAVLVERFAAEAARHLPDVEIVELHHDGKVDSPSGTALATAAAIAAARGGEHGRDPATPGARDTGPARGLRHHGVPIHSVRLPGLAAHEEVILGGQGQVLTLRHDAYDRSAYVPGVLAAVRGVARLEGLVVGLSAVL